MDNLKNTIERIEKMEQLLDEIAAINENYPERIAKDPEIQKKIQILENYFGSGQWMQDFECDERGELPVDLKRGVLLEDALYNLLEEVKGENGHQKEDFYGSK